MSGAHMLLVRHGEIEANRTRVWHGWTDSPLTDAGREQARRVGAHLAATRPEIRAIYASPLARAHETARAIGAALELEPEVRDGLKEYGIGELEGVSYRALYTEHGFFERIASDADHAPPGGESPNAVRRRMLAVLQQISADHPNQDVVVVGHGAAIALTLAGLVGRDKSAWQEWHSDNCALSELVLLPEARLVRFNESDYLR